MIVKTAYIRFYEELNDFLPSYRKKQTFLHSFKGDPSVKDIIESLGVPHTEVDLILVKGRSVGFSFKPSGGDHISVYPVFESLDITELTHLRHKPLRTVKFIADVHLGKLVAILDCWVLILYITAILMIMKSLIFLLLKKNHTYPRQAVT